MKFPRASGILLHPTSLPGDFGIGDLGPDAYSFVNFLEDAGQTYWQMLPLGPTGYGDSPYQCVSAFAGNPILISPLMLADEGLANKDDIVAGGQTQTDRVDFGEVHRGKSQMLRRVFEEFKSAASREPEERFRQFVKEHDWWLNDYAVYRAIKSANGQKPWFEWPEPLKLRDPAALAESRQALQDDINAEKFFQFIFFRQWGLLKEYANKHGVRIIGDLPIFTALDSADVWCNRDRFKLNPDGSPKVVAGVPPDYFSETGQLWGNPIYDWDAMRDDEFGWWIARMEFALRVFDIVRIDHFRGFVSAWEVPGGDVTAENGRWVDVPGAELFSAIKRALPALPVIAEDLGVITPDVVDLRTRLGFPGMKILQYAFGGDPANHDLPHNYTRDCVAYTGTHDNDTAVGWWRALVKRSEDPDDKSAPRELEYCKKYLPTSGDEIHWDLIRAIWASVADTAIVPVQDLLGIGSDGRMNVPSTVSGNWTWRLKTGQLTGEIGERLKDLTVIYGRKAEE
ncbi:MAG TPA: 4-alpha-glucanotransferase [Pyrinomonadaceae bacterium]|nr:4-alpha-glucanotransferase [Pyrinomonadaceae bacterium]